MAKELIGQASPEQIEKWKKEHGEISAAKTADGKVAYFKAPDRNILKMATDSVASGISEYNESIAENCFVGGEKSILSDPKYYNELGKAMNKLAEGEKITLEKL